jgi:hypothetical protein
MLARIFAYTVIKVVYLNHFSQTNLKKPYFLIHLDSKFAEIKLAILKDLDFHYL